MALENIFQNCTKFKLIDIEGIVLAPNGVYELSSKFELSRMPDGMGELKANYDREQNLSELISGFMHGLDFNWSESLDIHFRCQFHKSTDDLPIEQFLLPIKESKGIEGRVDVIFEFGSFSDRFSIDFGSFKEIDTGFMVTISPLRNKAQLVNRIDTAVNTQDTTTLDGSAITPLNEVSFLTHSKIIRLTSELRHDGFVNVLDDNADDFITAFIETLPDPVINDGLSYGQHVANNRYIEYFYAVGGAWVKFLDTGLFAGPFATPENADYKTLSHRFRDNERNFGLAASWTAVPLNQGIPIISNDLISSGIQDSMTISDSNEFFLEFQETGVVRVELKFRALYHYRYFFQTTIFPFVQAGYSTTRDGGEVRVYIGIELFDEFDVPIPDTFKRTLLETYEFDVFASGTNNPSPDFGDRVYDIDEEFVVFANATNKMKVFFWVEHEGEYILIGGPVIGPNIDLFTQISLGICKDPAGDRFIKASQDTVSFPSVTKGYFWDDLIGYLTRSISDNDMNLAVGPYTNINERGKQVICSGFGLRGFEYSEKPIQTDLKTQLEGHSLVHGSGIGLTDTQVLLLEIPSFYDGTLNMLGLSYVPEKNTDYSQELDNSIVPNAINYQYDGFSDEGDNNNDLDTLQSQMELALRIKNSEQRIELKSDVHGSAYEIENARRLRFNNEPDKSSKYDESTFYIHVIESNDIGTPLFRVEGQSLTDQTLYYIGNLTDLLDGAAKISVGGLGIDEWDSYSYNSETGETEIFKAAPGFTGLQGGNIGGIPYDEYAFYNVEGIDPGYPRLIEFFDISDNPLSFLRAETDDGFSAVSGVISPNTMYNLRHSIGASIKRRSRWFASLLSFNDKVGRRTKKDGNKEFIGTGIGIVEDINYTTDEIFSGQLFRSEIVDFSTTIGWDDLNVLRENIKLGNYGFIEVKKYNGDIVKIFPLSLSYGNLEDSLTLEGKGFFINFS